MTTMTTAPSAPFRKAGTGSTTRPGTRRALNASLSLEPASGRGATRNENRPRRRASTRELAEGDLSRLSGSVMANRPDILCIPPRDCEGSSWGAPERMWQWLLSPFECGTELFHLFRKNRDLAERYEVAMRAHVEGGAMAGDFEDDLRRLGRKAVYDAEGITLETRSGSPSAYGGTLFSPLAREMLDRTSLFDIAVHGGLKLNLLWVLLERRYPEALAWDHGIHIASSAQGDRLGEPVCVVTFNSQQLTRSVFLKTSSMYPDLFAAGLFSGTGVVLPCVSVSRFPHPEGYYSQYGMMGHLAATPGVSAGSPLSTLGSNPLLSGRLRGGVREFAERLGHAFELCRKRGVQDRHPSNVWLLLRDNGSLAIGMIDMDLTGCYPHDNESYQSEFAARLKGISTALFGTMFRSESGFDEPDQVRAVLNALRAGFMAGAMRAHGEDLARERNIRAQFAGQDGQPVGLYVRPGRIMQIFGCQNGWFVTSNPINGPQRQRLFIAGPESGRILFNADAAWEHGYLRQKAIAPEDFWAAAFAMAPDSTSKSIIY